MKKTMLLITAMIAIALMFGCAGMGVQPDPNTDILVKIAGHRAGFELGKADLQAAIKFQTASEKVIAMVETGQVGEANTYLHQIINELTMQIAKDSDDPALMAELMILSEMLVFQGDVTLPLDPATLQKYLVQMKSFMEGYKLGISLATMYQ